MIGEHLDPSEIAGLAMLDARDPERVRADAHAKGCAECREALASAFATLSAMDALVDPPAPTAVALGRARHAVRALIRPVSMPSIALVAALALAGFVIPLVTMRWVAEMPWLLTITALAIVIGRTAIALARGDTRDAGMALFFALGLSAVLAVLDADGNAGGHGIGCALVELGAAILPAGAALVLGRSGRIDPTPLSMAAVAASGALAGQLALHALCADRELEHLIPFHLGAVIASALIAGIAQRLASPREA